MRVMFVIYVLCLFLLHVYVDHNDVLLFDFAKAFDDLDENRNNVIFCYTF